MKRIKASKVEVANGKITPSAQSTEHPLLNPSSKTETRAKCDEFFTDYILSIKRDN